MRKKSFYRILAGTVCSAVALATFFSVNHFFKSEASSLGLPKQLTDEDISELHSDVSFTRTAVHDPSITYDEETGLYYVLGSHLGFSSSSDLMNWTGIATDNALTYDMFEDVNGKIVDLNDAFNKNAYIGDENGKIVTVIDGVKQEVDFGSYDAEEWHCAISGWVTTGNMWAPDLIYNEKLDKWCMYLSLNGPVHNSIIIMLSSDKVTGPYVYEGPIVYSGFTNDAGKLNYKLTDLELVLGELDTLPTRYQKLSTASAGTDSDGYILNEGDIVDDWGEYWPHAIDPCTYYDDDGNLWLAYGSWSGGIYTLQLDENTGLRDYTISYESNGDSLGKSVTSDAYFGKKIAGGYYVSGEGSYIEKIGDYYYLFMSYGFFAPNGGYQMRIFRSENPDGPFVDTTGTDAIYTSFSLNYPADWTWEDGEIDNRGMRLMTYYKWSNMAKGEVAQGHNSAITTKDGRSYVVYHTKFNDGSFSHEVRTHELFQNKNGWILASPYEFSNDEALDYTKGYTTSDLADEYEVIISDYSLGYSGTGSGADSTTMDVITPTNYTFKSDGTILDANGNKAGSYTVSSDSPYTTIKLGDYSFSGVFVKQTKDTTGFKTMCFTAVDEATGVTIWGSAKLSDQAVLTTIVNNPTFTVPKNVYGSFTLPTEEANGATVSWKSSNTDILADDGTLVKKPSKDTVITLTETITYGDYYYEKNFDINVKAFDQNTCTDGFILSKAYSDDVIDLKTHSTGDLSIDNPFYYGQNAGLDLSGGVSVSFDTTNPSETINALAGILSFRDTKTDTGRLYFTSGSYLGYNVGTYGGWYDANLNSYALVKDYIGASAHITLSFTTDTFSVSVDGNEVYTKDILDTENGDGTLTDHSLVLTWLYEKANLVYLGSGSWWADAAYNTISNIEFFVNPIANSNEPASTTTPVAEVTTAPSEEVTISPTEETTVSPAEEITISPTEEATISPTEKVTSSPIVEPTQKADTSTNKENIFTKIINLIKNFFNKFF